VTDNATSIADKTFMLFDEHRRPTTAARFALLDTNADGELSGDELSSLSAWADTNENGHLDDGEVRSLVERGIERLRSSEFALFARGNGTAVGM
uniref:hypothetical protein n=1 Tax=Pseudomonas viridiflava TaxID=33069 RepID=UPI0019D19830